MFSYMRCVAGPFQGMATAPTCPSTRSSWSSESDNGEPLFLACAVTARWVHSMRTLSLKKNEEQWPRQAASLLTSFVKSVLSRLPQYPGPPRVKHHWLVLLSCSGHHPCTVTADLLVSVTWFHGIRCVPGPRCAGVLLHLRSDNWLGPRIRCLLDDVSRSPLPRALASCTSLPLVDPTQGRSSCVTMQATPACSSPLARTVLEAYCGL